VIKTLIEKYKGYSNRQIARICGVSHVTVGDVKGKLENPPELAKFKAWKKTWDELPDDQRMTFVKEYEADIREMLQA
jgi:transposase